MCQGELSKLHLREMSVKEVNTIGLDIVKYTFHAHVVNAASGVQQEN